MIWKRAWYSRLFGLVTALLFVFFVTPHHPLRGVLGQREDTILVACGFAVGWAAGWAAFLLQEHRRNQNQRPPATGSQVIDVQPEQHSASEVWSPIKHRPLLKRLLGPSVYEAWFADRDSQPGRLRIKFALTFGVLFVGLLLLVFRITPCSAVTS